MTRAILIAGLGYGDEGKGTIVDFLAAHHNAELVVRYNGGPQAGHNVVTDDGKHHVFSQFGSGAFAGSRTHLSKFMLVNPITLDKEAIHLHDLTGEDPFEKLTIHKDALLVTPYHVMVNRLRELSRGDNRHGSCGMGIGETVSDSIAYGDEAIRIGDLLDLAVLRKKLREIREEKLHDAEVFDLPLVGTARGYYEILRDEVSAVAGQYNRLVRKLNIVDDDYVRKEIQSSNVVIFEGAQGILLDQDFGFQPHTTWTDITFTNAEKLLEGLHIERTEHYGVLRTFSTRHGVGPFVTESDMKLPSGEDNVTGPWQGSFRAGPLDLVATRYGIQVLKGVDHLAITHADCYDNMKTLCHQYDTSPNRFLDPGEIHIRTPAEYWFQAEITKALYKAKPVLSEVDTPEACLLQIQDALHAPIGIISHGPRRKNKRLISIE